MAKLLTLCGGLTVNEDAVILALALEAKGHALSVKDGALVVTNGSALSLDDRASIKRLRLHLMAVAAYEAPV